MNTDTMTPAEELREHRRRAYGVALAEVEALRADAEARPEVAAARARSEALVAKLEEAKAAHAATTAEADRADDLVRKALLAGGDVTDAEVYRDETAADATRLGRRVADLGSAAAEVRQVYRDAHREAFHSLLESRRSDVAERLPPLEAAVAEIKRRHERELLDAKKDAAEVEILERELRDATA